ncbi:MAG: endonuclease domain-containing protein [Actinomycetota bacterium]|nr:endonuclease domain-containing protein [Actinomycetota bacterium]
MHTLDVRIAAMAAGTANVFTRADVFRCGGTDEAISIRLESQRWQQLHPGVYLLGAAPPTWLQQVRAAILAAGEGAEASHRCGLVVWGADGITAAPVELVVPYNGRPEPAGVIVHRSRRLEPASIVDGISVTSVERTLLESATVTPPVVTEKAFAWAWRRNLTSPAKCELYLEHHGGKGRRGTGRLREIVALYADGGRPPGSDGEVVFLRCLREAGIEEPVRQLLVDLPGGAKAAVDFGWPDRRKLVEFVGLEVHADSRAHAADTLREDDIKSAGWELRRFAPDTLRRQPEDVARRVLRFLL